MPNTSSVLGSQSRLCEVLLWVTGFSPALPIHCVTLYATPPSVHQACDVARLRPVLSIAGECQALWFFLQVSLCRCRLVFQCEQGFLNLQCLLSVSMLPVHPSASNTQTGHHHLVNAGMCANWR